MVQYYDGNETKALRTAAVNALPHNVINSLSSCHVRVAHRMRTFYSPVSVFNAHILKMSYKQEQIINILHVGRQLPHTFSESPLMCS